MDKFSQLVVWEGVNVPPSQIEEFENWIQKEYNTRAKHYKQITTLAGLGGEGGRIDCLFWIHEDDISQFAVSRLARGFRWWEDVLSNGGGVLYPEQLKIDILTKQIGHSLRKQAAYKVK